MTYWTASKSPKLWISTYVHRKQELLVVKLPIASYKGSQRVSTVTEVRSVRFPTGSRNEHRNRIFWWEINSDDKTLRASPKSESPWRYWRISLPIKGRYERTCLVERVQLRSNSSKKEEDCVSWARDSSSGSIPTSIFAFSRALFIVSIIMAAASASDPFFPLLLLLLLQLVKTKNWSPELRDRHVVCTWLYRLSILSFAIYFKIN